MASLDAKGGDAECELDFAELQLAMGNLGEALRREREDMLR